MMHFKIETYFWSCIRRGPAGVGRPAGEHRVAPHGRGERGARAARAGPAAPQGRGGPAHQRTQAAPRSRAAAGAAGAAALGLAPTPPTPRLRSHTRPRLRPCIIRQQSTHL
ncbi:unnamed protein product [Arctia plantaginis]|uniref:Uncharacterized protein n=1 Tax=Arctia plantaginis TaxID=874455 RepID=A0A8S0ZKF4_ARCPL|nr:unnamed protein product [Arctia plantaginis]CAB3238256.1 unnamed protein product [Arctia plantaginis]